MGDQDEDLLKKGGKYIKNKIASRGFKKARIIIIAVFLVIIIFAGTNFINIGQDANYSSTSPGNVQYNVETSVSNLSISTLGNLQLGKSAKELWNDIIKNDGNITKYLSNASELKKLMNAQFVTQFMDTRPDTSKKINWSEINEDIDSKEIQGIVKLNRAGENGQITQMHYVSESEYNSIINEYNRTGTEEAKQKALSVFTLGVNRTASSSSDARLSSNAFLQAVKEVADMVFADKNNYKYGNSTTTPPCEFEIATTPPYAGQKVKFISCDRIAARALYNLGFTDQPAGGITCSDAAWLEAHGFVKITNQDELQRGRYSFYGYTRKC